MFYLLHGLDFGRGHLHVVLRVELICGSRRLWSSIASFPFKLFLVKVDIILLDVDNGLAKEGIGFPYKRRGDLSSFELMILYIGDRDKECLLLKCNLLVQSLR